MNNETFYILVEGEPESPELSFLQKTISDIFINNHIFYVPQVVEIGSSSILPNSSLAKTFYRLSKAHKNVPVLAIADSDYRVSEDKKQKISSEIVNAQKTKILYWQRHEWENYLLEETQLIADFVNEFPENSKKSGGFSKKSKIQVAKQDLDNHLESYFIQSIKKEFFTCLKFHLKSAKRDKKSEEILEPDNFEKKSFEDIQYWFMETASNRKITLKPLRESLYQEIKDEFKWNDFISNPNNFSFEFAKKHFRGKEAFKSLIDFICKEFKCHIDPKQFQIELLKRLDNTSPLVSDLTFLLLTELTQC